MTPLPFLVYQALDLFVPTGPSGRGRPALRPGELTAVLPSPPGEESESRPRASWDPVSACPPLASHAQVPALQTGRVSSSSAPHERLPKTPPSDTRHWWLQLRPGTPHRPHAEVPGMRETQSTPAPAPPRHPPASPRHPSQAAARGSSATGRFPGSGSAGGRAACAATLVRPSVPWWGWRPLS